MRRTTKPVGISIPPQLIEKIDKDRGDIPRSIFVTRLIEQAYREREKGKK